MKQKVHLCCGDIYLIGYTNCDIDGKMAKECTADEIAVNATTIDKYFKYPFEKDATKRVRRQFIIDKKMNILGKFPFANGSIDEIVSVSAFEHFEHHTELQHIIKEVRRVLAPGGVWKFDFPDIEEIVKRYSGRSAEWDEFMMEQIFCNRKNKYSVHCWSYTKRTIPLYLHPDQWELTFEDTVKHDYPMQGCQAKKI